MDDQRIKARTLFCFENLRYCDRIERVGSEAVHCFRGQADAFARAQNRYYFHALKGGKDFCFHSATPCASTAWVCFFRNASSFFRTLSSKSARMLAARSPAFFAPADPIASVPTG